MRHISNLQLTPEKHNHQTLKQKHSSDAHLLQTQGGTPNEYGNKRGSGYSLLAHPLLLDLRRWLTRCRCQMHRGY
jgi:hypothetical protein